MSQGDRPTGELSRAVLGDLPSKHLARLIEDSPLQPFDPLRLVVVDFFTEPIVVRHIVGDPRSFDRVLVVSRDRFMILPWATPRGGRGVVPALDYAIGQLRFVRERIPSRRLGSGSHGGAVVALENEELFIGSTSAGLGREIAARLKMLLPTGLPVGMDLVEGCLLLGGSGYPLQPGDHVQLAFDADGVDIQSPGDSIRIPQADLIEVELDGPGTVTTDAGIIGGGFGFEGAAKGMLAASVINGIFRKTTTNTIIWIRTVSGELCFHHSIEAPDTLRLRLSRVFVRLREQPSNRDVSVSQTVADHSLVEQLERLGSLHQGGMLSAKEYAVAKAKLLS